MKKLEVDRKFILVVLALILTASTGKYFDFALVGVLAYIFFAD